MFYDKKLMNSKFLGKAWRAANDYQCEPDEETSLPKICEKLDEWVGSEAGDSRKRLSLRASAIFIDGAAKLYMRGLQRLLEDTGELHKDMSFSKRRRVSDKSDARTGSVTEEDDSSDAEEMPEQMLQGRRSKEDFETSRMSTSFKKPSKYPTKKQNRASTSSNRNGDEPWTSGNYSRNPITSNDSIDFNSVKTENCEENPTGIQTKEQEVQTCFPFFSHRCDGDSDMENNGEFDENLPFGYIVIHDNYGSRIPNKIIFTSLNVDVNRLF